MQNDEKEIRELVDTWMAATKGGDLEKVLDLMTDDVVFLVPGHAPFGKSAFAEASKAQSSASVEFDGKSEIQEIKVLRDWAFVLTKLAVSATQPGHGKPIVRSGHTLSVLHKQGGKWRVARDANLLAESDGPMTHGQAHVHRGSGSVRPYLHGPADLPSFLERTFDAAVLERNEDGPTLVRIGDSFLWVEAGELPSHVTPWVGSVYVYVENVDESKVPSASEPGHLCARGQAIR